jgi:hypothetical protein
MRASRVEPGGLMRHPLRLTALVSLLAYAGGAALVLLARRARSLT